MMPAIPQCARFLAGRLPYGGGKKENKLQPAVAAATHARMPAGLKQMAHRTKLNRRQKLEEGARRLQKANHLRQYSKLQLYGSLSNPQMGPEIMLYLSGNLLM